MFFANNTYTYLKRRDRFRNVYYLRTLLVTMMSNVTEVPSLTLLSIRKTDALLLFVIT